MTFKIETIHAFVSVDEDGEEGVIAAPLGGIPMPLIAADERRLKQLRPIADAMARAMHIKVKLVRFSLREDLETFDYRN